MDNRFDGPDLYAVVGSVAGELIDLSDEVENKVDKFSFDSELKSQKSDMSSIMIKDLTKFKLDMSKDVRRELDLMKADYEAQIKQVRTGWIGAFGNMKNAFRGVFF